MQLPSEKRIVTDEEMRPVAVQIPYRDWLEIEKRLGGATSAVSGDLSRHEGRLRLPEDPSAFQKRLRDEWA
ncbi:MAG: hypothetical protein PHU25_14165 [Deltaproteobacteria bacterium]|nr:hypothetical protein [Deltaproteobacteria bacterium]